MPGKFWIVLSVCVTLLISCQRNEGEGGRTTLTGQVYYRLTDESGTFLGREEAREEDVYIVYGDNDHFDDDRKTHFNGQYEFEYLFKGEYTIYGYSECNGCDSGIEPTSITVDLSGKNEVHTAPDLELTKILSPDDGYATVTGRVKVQEYNTSGELVAEYFQGDRDVFITYGDQLAPFERVETSGDGYFSIPNLILGDYTIYAFSDCNNCPEDITPVEVEATIAIRGESIDVGTIVVDQR